MTPMQEWQQAQSANLLRWRKKNPKTYRTKGLSPEAFRKAGLKWHTRQATACARWEKEHPRPELTPEEQAEQDELQRISDGLSGILRGSR